MRKLLLFLCIFIGLFNLALPVSTAQAWSLFPTKVCTKKDAAGKVVPITDKDGNKSSVCTPGAEGNPVAKLIGQVAGIIALIAGFVAVIIIIVSGFQFVTSGGNTETVSKARGKIIGAIIGLIIIVFAWTIIRLVTDRIIQ